MSGSLKNLEEKNITILLGSLELGGAERQALHYSLYLKKKFNANIEICGFSGPGKSTEFCNKNNIPWRILQNPLSKNPVKRLFLFHKFIRDLNETQPDLILPYTLTPNVAAGIAWRKTSAKLCVWNQRDAGIEHFNHRIENRALNGSSMILSNSHVGAEFLLKNYLIDSSKIHIIPNAIEMDPPQKTRDEWRGSLNIGASTFIACMVANLSPKKDHDTLIYSWKKVMDSASDLRQEKPHLILAGRFDESYESLKNLVEKLQLSNYIHFLGKVDDISGLLQSTDLGILSSRIEGCPNGILECMAQCLPVIGTNIPGIREAVGIGNLDFLVPVGDSVQLARKIQLLIKDETLRMESGVSNKLRIQTCFNPKVIWHRQSSLIAEHMG
jgi:glycosyltransferase involved in cell wall biosynthesis